MDLFGLAITSLFPSINKSFFSGPFLLVSYTTLAGYEYECNITLSTKIAVFCFLNIGLFYLLILGSLFYQKSILTFPVCHLSLREK